MDKIEYEYYLRSPQWKRLKSDVWNRANSCCERCRYQWEYGNLRRLHVHHLTYERVGDELLSDLQLLCEDCHEYVHGHSKYDPCRILSFDELLEEIEQLMPRTRRVPPTPEKDNSTVVMTVTTVDDEECGSEEDRRNADRALDLLGES